MRLAIVLVAGMSFLVGSLLVTVVTPVAFTGRTLFEVAGSLPAGVGGDVLLFAMWLVITLFAGLIGAAVAGGKDLAGIVQVALTVFGIVAVQSLWVGYLVAATLEPIDYPTYGPVAPYIPFVAVGLLAILVALIMRFVPSRGKVPAPEVGSTETDRDRAGQ